MKKKEKTAGQTVRKRPFFTTNNLIAAVVCFVVFLVVSLGVYYITAGEFVTAKLASVYAILALVGAMAVLLRFYRFVSLYYVGCALGWITGYCISNLKGEFAPKAGAMTTIFFIGVFIMFGCIAQGKGIRKAFLRWREERGQKTLKNSDKLPEPVRSEPLPVSESKPLPQPEEEEPEFDLTPDPVLTLEAEEPEGERWNEEELAEARKARESAELAMDLKFDPTPTQEQEQKDPSTVQNREAKTVPLPLDLDETPIDELMKF